MPTTLTVLNLKGGTGKTTTAAHVAQALHELGARVLAVDADPMGGLMRWHERVAFPFPVVGQASGKLHRELPGIVGDRWNVVVIDTPPAEDRRPIVESAARAATHVIVPLFPSTAVHERLGPVRDLLEDAAVGNDFHTAVLLVNVKRSAASGEVYRANLEADGWRVLRPIVPDREAYRQAWGAPLQRRHVADYSDAVVELLEGAPA